MKKKKGKSQNKKKNLKKDIKMKGTFSKTKKNQLKSTEIETDKDFHYNNYICEQLCEFEQPKGLL